LKAKAFFGIPSVLALNGFSYEINSVEVSHNVEM
jgi:hypothetical protein